jgi:N-acetyl sugar amidotransferase
MAESQVVSPTSPSYRICRRCIMDTSVPEISFDAEGNCNFCTAALARLDEQLLAPAERDAKLAELVARVKQEGQGKEYDCIIGVSGGVDSTTVAYKVKELGLRPLAVHFDNGWNSELAVDNITKALKELDIELYTYVVDWEEFKDLQLSFIKASVVNCEAPTDHGIGALLLRTAAERGTRFILSGSNLATETIQAMPYGHFNQDLRQLKGIHKRFGTVPLETMPTVSVRMYAYYVFVKRIRPIPFLNLIDYDKEAWKVKLAEAIGWRDYGGKHYESVWTRFFQGYFLPHKVGYDKRRAHHSSLICSGQMTRDEALADLEDPPYDEALLKEDLEYVLKKFGLSAEEFDAYLAAPAKPPTAYPNHSFLFDRMERYRKMFRKFATSA